MAVVPQDPKTRTHRLFGRAEGSSIWCIELVKSLGNAIAPSYQIKEFIVQARIAKYRPICSLADRKRYFLSTSFLLLKSIQ